MSLIFRRNSVGDARSLGGRQGSRAIFLCKNPSTTALMLRPVRKLAIHLRIPKITNSAMVEAILTVINQSVIHQINQELAIYNVLLPLYLRGEF